MELSKTQMGAGLVAIFGGSFFGFGAVILAAFSKPGPAIIFAILAALCFFGGLTVLGVRWWRPGSGS